MRIAHWALAALIVYDWIDDSGDALHRWAGYAAAGVVIVRWLYGLANRAGPSALRLPRPTIVFAYLRGMLRGQSARVAGHNPAGAAMAWLLWSLVLGLAFTGWIARLDRFWGDDWPVAIHAVLSTALQVAVVVHLLGVAVSSVLERQNLAAAMVTGKKHVD